MYESYFNFREKPFSLLPDAHFLYLSKKHNLALTILRYGLDSQALITVITGDIGCGKTTLLRKLIGEVSDNVTVGLITNTHGAFGDLLKWVLLSFDLDYREKSKVEQYQDLVDFVISEYAHKRNTVLIVDEAQNLDDGALEELRMLSNINVDEHQVLQLVLVGQPELRQALRRPELRQFAQRVSADYHILPLEPEETAPYIQHRLSVVGGDPFIFLPETYPLVHDHSNGVPRLINILCDTALVYAYGSQQRTVDSELIREVIRDRESGVYFENPESNTVRHTDVGVLSTVESEQDVSPTTEAPHVSTDKTHIELAFKHHRQLGSHPNLARPQDELFENEREGDVEVEPADADEDGTMAVGTRPMEEASSSPTPKIITVVASVLAILLSTGVLYIYQKPSVISASLQKTSQAQIQGWLVEAEQYLNTGKLVAPAGANAYDMLQKVFEREPDNPDAQAGMEVLRDKLFTLATMAQAQAEWTAARGQLESLLQIDPQSKRARAALNAVTKAQEESVFGQKAARAQIKSWLVEADQYLNAGKLVSPVGANAYNMLQKVLEREPDNPYAQAGMDLLGDKLFAAVTVAQARREWTVARSHLEILLRIDPQSERAHAALNTLTDAQEEVETPADTSASTDKQPMIDQDILNILKRGLDEIPDTTNRIGQRATEQ